MPARSDSFPRSSFSALASSACGWPASLPAARRSMFSECCHLRQQFFLQWLRQGGKALRADLGQLLDRCIQLYAVAAVQVILNGRAPVAAQRFAHSVIVVRAVVGRLQLL